MSVHTQADLDVAFAELEHLLDRPAPLRHPLSCAGCGGREYEYACRLSGCPGSRVCRACGVVDDGPVFWETMYGHRIPTKSSNYKRIHHWHERISQFTLMESEIPPEQMWRIASKLCDGTHAVIDKDAIRAVLRSLSMQSYIEKWLQIIHRTTGIQPPCPGALLLEQMDRLFIELQRPFDAHKHEKRKNFLNYNYVFCRLLQKLGCTGFSMFFPLIKSHTKLATLDRTWNAMATSVGWPITPLIHVPAFAVRVERPDLLLLRLRATLVARDHPAPERAPCRMVSRQWGRRDLRATKSPPKRPRSPPSAPEFQRLAPPKRRRL